MNRKSLIRKILREGLNLPKKPMSLFELMMAWENGEGELTNAQIQDLFSQLVKSGDAWSLQGTYGRAARKLIDAGFLDNDGNKLMEL